MSYAETFRVIEAQLPNIEGLLEKVEMKRLFLEVPDDWFRKFDIPARGVQLPDRRCWLITSQQFDEIMDIRPGPNREKGVGYRWKEVY